ASEGTLTRPRSVNEQSVTVRKAGPVDCRHPVWRAILKKEFHAKTQRKQRRKACRTPGGVLCGFLCVFAFFAPLREIVPPYQNPNLPIETRVNDLVSRMTLEEKVLQMQNAAPAIERLDIAKYDWWNEALHGVARAGTATVFPQAIGLAATC